MQTLYSFLNKKSKCYKEQIFDNFKKKYLSNLKVDEVTNESLLEFTYSYGTGLVLKNDKKKSNILGEFLSLDDDIDKLRIFIEKYGYFFPLKSECMQINHLEILLWKDRLNCIAEILKEIQNKKVTKINYNNLLKYSFFLLFNNYFDFYDDKTKELEVLKEINNISTYPNNYTEDIQNIKESNGSLIGYILINDSLATDNTQKLNLEEFSEEIENLKYHKVTKNVLLSFRHLEILKSTLHPMDIKIIELLYHLYKDHNFYFDDITNMESINKIINNNSIGKIKDKVIKDRILEIAKYLVATELNNNLKKVTPKYDFVECKPNWKLEDLYSAINLSLFFLDPEYMILKRCANSYCDAFFMVTATNTRKKYCCDTCTKNATQRAYMHRKKTEDKA